MKKLGVIAIVLCMILGVFAGCANNGGQTTDPTTGPNSGGTTAPQSTAPVSTEPAKAEPYGIFRNYITGEIETLNAHMWSSSNAGTMISMTTMVLYQQLPSEDRKSFYLSGEFAESEPKQVDAEGLKWEIKLRENCVWDNGDKMDVNDVIYSFKMCLDPLLVNSRASQLASDYITIKNATPYYLQGSDNTVAWEDVGIYAVSDYVLGIELDAPVTAADIMSHFNYSWTCMVHEPTYEAGMSSDRTTTTYGSTVEKFMSCGRFIVTDWINGSVMNFKRNDNYFNDSIMLEGYQYKMLADSNTALELS